MDELVLAGITVYPLKSGAGLDLDASDMEPCGLRGDRRWMAIDGDGVCVTARERPQLVRIRAENDGTALRLEMQGREPLTVRYPDSGAPAARVWIWGQACNALDAGDTAARWMSDALNKPVRLVAMDDRFKRRPDPDCTLPEDEVSFADCYPVLAIGRSSLDDLNTRTPAPASMRRFRPNFVVSGGEPYAEDDWRRIRIGSVEFEGVENCERCELPTVDPETGIPDPRREPMRTLARYRRRVTGGVFLGQNLVPRGAGTVRVGDRVVVLESADSGQAARFTHLFRRSNASERPASRRDRRQPSGRGRQ